MQLCLQRWYSLSNVKDPHLASILGLLKCGQCYMIGNICAVIARLKINQRKKSGHIPYYQAIYHRPNLQIAVIRGCIDCDNFSQDTKSLYIDPISSNVCHYLDRKVE